MIPFEIILEMAIVLIGSLMACLVFWLLLVGFCLTFDPKERLALPEEWRGDQ